jgi:hypothetical protein
MIDRRSLFRGLALAPLALPMVIRNPSKALASMKLKRGVAGNAWLAPTVPIKRISSIEIEFQEGMFKNIDSIIELKLQKIAANRTDEEIGKGFAPGL